MRTLLLAIAISLLALSAAPRDAFAQRGPGHGAPPGGGAPYHGGYSHGGGHHGGGGHHDGHHYSSWWWGPRFSVGVWPGYYGYGWRTGFGWGDPYYLYPYSYYAPLYPYWQPSLRATVEDPPEYIQRDDANADAPPERAWYYCKTRHAYYPKVQTCPEPWIPVPSRD